MNGKKIVHPVGRQIAVYNLRWFYIILLLLLLLLLYIFDTGNTHAGDRGG